MRFIKGLRLSLHENLVKDFRATRYDGSHGPLPPRIRRKANYRSNVINRHKHQNLSYKKTGVIISSENPAFLFCVYF
ncbi:MAG: hypothetical protein C4527_02850 [Candidatus Omnitrophota bacterium]|nr:MAG: hypothetical protein C4527_02850 [Candidatus Omnitrophota bacterium]